MRQQQLRGVGAWTFSMPGIGVWGAWSGCFAWDAKARVLILSAHNDDIVPVRALRLGPRVISAACSAGRVSARGRRENSISAGIDLELAPAVSLAQLSASANPVEALTEKELAVFQLAQGKRSMKSLRIA